MLNYPYPQAPSGIAEDLTKVSPRYKSQIIRVLGSILLFMAVYLLILYLAVKLVYYGGYAALMVVSAHFSIIALLVALGILMMVGMFLFFIIKFLFKIKHDEDPNRIEIRESQQPELFDFVRRVCKEAKAPFPKRIYLSPDVNAAVFYNSSFLSMFFPVRKNLLIGMGLINSLNISEFKAVLAHEFGHFSQSSTRLGSYVYRLNRMIHNLLFDNDSWSKALSSVASIHWVTSIFGHITIWLVQGVLWIFSKFYQLINLSYMSLSREMEYHADLVAVSVSGSDEIVKALYRIEFSQETYTYTSTLIREAYEKEKKLPANFFQLHNLSTYHFARNNRVQMNANGLPLLNAEITKQILLPSRIDYKNLWTTHPSIEERSKNAHRMSVPGEVVEEPASGLIRDKAKVEELLSLNVYEYGLSINDKKTVPSLELEAFFEEKGNKGNINARYAEFYRYGGEAYSAPEQGDATKIEAILALPFEAIFNKENTQHLARKQRNERDLEVLKQIGNKQIPVRKFEFDGESYSRSEVERVEKKLEQEIAQDKLWYETQKTTISTWFYHRLLAKDVTRATLYREVLALRQQMALDMEKLLEHYKKVIEFYFSLQNTTMELSTALSKLTLLKQDFSEVVAGIADQEVSEAVKSRNILAQGYRATLFEGPVTVSREGIQHLIDRIEHLQSLFSNASEEEERLQQLQIALQDELLGDPVQP